MCLSALERLERLLLIVQISLQNNTRKCWHRSNLIPERFSIYDIG